MVRRGYADAARVIAVSDYLLRCIREQGFTGRFDVIPNPVDCDLFIPSPDREEFSVVSVGRFSADKRPELLLRAFALAHDAEPRLTLTWIGAGPLRSRMEALARDLGVDAAVDFVGPLSRAEVAGHVGRARVFLNAAQAETFGVAVAEALAAGVPVVAPRLGALSELVDEASGILVDGAGPSAMAEGIVKALAVDFDGEAIAARIRDRCGFQAVGRQLEAVYRSVT
jgi:glycosyltransferase involved in cell wall biosynthesis